VSSTVTDLDRGLEDRTVVVNAGVLGELSVQPPSLEVEVACRRALRLPHRVSAATFTNGLVGACLEPDRSAAEVAELPGHIRGRLRVAVVEACEMLPAWRALYGSHLTADERLVAVMVWHVNTADLRVAERLRAARAVLDATASATQVPPIAGAEFAATQRLRDQIELTKKLARGPLNVPTQLARTHKVVYGAGLMGDDLARAAPSRSVTDSLTRILRGLEHQPPWSLALDAGVRRHEDVLSRALGLNAESGRVNPRFDFAARQGTGELLPGLMGRAQAAHTRWPGIVDAPGRLMAAFGLGASSAHDWRDTPIARSLGLGRVDTPGSLASSMSSISRLAIGGYVGRPTDRAFLSTCERVSSGEAVRGRLPESRLLNNLGLPNISVMAGGLTDAIQHSGDWLKRGPTIRVDELLEQSRRVAAWLKAIEAFMRRWEQRGWHFLLAQFGLGTLSRLARLEHAHVEPVLLDAVEATVREEREFVDALQQVIDEVPFFTSPQRHHLKHALDHAKHGQLVDADPPLTRALEGAFVQAGVAGGIITADRRHVERPSKEVGFESMVKLLIVEDSGLRTFVVREAYGDAGNPFRHGSNADGDREHALVLIVALVGLLDLITEYDIVDLFGDLVDERVPYAVHTRRALEISAS
jgi:hypothetical protein